MGQPLAPVVTACQALPDNKAPRENLASPSRVPEVSQGHLERLQNAWQTQHVAKGPGVKLDRLDQLDHRDGRESEVTRDLKEILGLLGRLVQLAQVAQVDHRDLKGTLD
jgi:hypothetical protein